MDGMNGIARPKADAPGMAGTDATLRHPPFPSSPFAFTWWVVRRFAPGRAVLLLAITVISTALHAATPYIVGRFVDMLDRVLRGDAGRADMHGLFGLLILAWLVGPLIGRLYTLANAFTMPRMRAEIDSALFGWTLGQSVTFFQNSFAGSLTQQIRKAGRAAPDIFESFVLPFARVAVTMVVAGLLLWTALPIYAVAFGGFAVVFVGVSLVMARRVGTVVDRLAQARSAVSGRIADAMATSEVVRSFSGLDHETRTLRPFIETEYARGQRARIHFTAMRVSQLLLSVGFMSVLLWVALDAAVAGRLSPGAVAMILTIGVQLTLSINQLGDDILGCFEHVGDLKESLDALARPQRVVDAPAAVPLAVRDGAIALRDVRFGYDSGRPVFHGLSFSIAGGERVGLAGSSGAGKSTLFKLLTRQYELDGGTIAIDGQAISATTLDSLRRSIAEVSQVTELFHRTILDNIRYARPDAHEAEVVAAAKAAHCHEFIMARPNGYATVVGERGVKLSGGERQRIAIARAILKDAPILLLDEATSALDTESEGLIQDALARLMRGRTVVAIAHRLSTIAHMDRIIVLDQGAIVEDAPHDVLLAQRGRYADLWHRQYRRRTHGDLYPPEGTTTSR